MDNGQRTTSSGATAATTSVATVSILQPQGTHQIHQTAPPVRGPFAGWAGFGNPHHSQATSSSVQPSATPAQQNVQQPMMGAVGGPVQQAHGTFSGQFLSKSARYVYFSNHL